MLGEMFMEDGDTYDTGASAAIYTSYSKAKPKNCAGDMEMPPLPRQKSNLVGLQNQGATCYLNSLFQTLYMTPQFRSAIYSLPLCGSSVDEQSDFVTGQKREILFAIQKLFVMLQKGDNRSMSTEELTKAFGWVNNEQLQQHDVQELNRVLFDVIERALKETVYEALIQELYTGVMSNLIICQNCGVSRKREENFLDLPLQVKGCEGVHDSLKQLFEFDKMEGNNQIFCDNCNKKTDTLKGARVQRLPPVMTFCLYRFELDYNTFQRKKLNDRFEYPLEVNMSNYLDAEALEDEDAVVYELKSIIIHRGGAYGGHYYAYIQDELQEGNWYLSMPETFKAEPVEIEKKTFNPKDHMTDEQIKELELEKNKNKSPNGNKKNQKEQRNNNLKNNNKSNKKGKKDKQESQQKEVEFDYNECDFPLPYSEKRLVENWYDFNDSTITPILPGKLQSQFGGSNENAYMLVYRQKKLSKQIQKGQLPDIPNYWKSAVEAQNKDNQLQRMAYQQMEDQLDLVVQEQDLFIIDPETKFISYKEDSLIDDQGFKLQARFSDKIGEVKSRLREILENSEFWLFEVDRLRNGFCQIRNNMNSLSDDQLVEGSKITHLSTWILVRDPALAKTLALYVGEDIQPINIKMRFYGEEATIQLYSNTLLEELMDKVEALTSIPKSMQSLKVNEENLIRRVDRQIFSQEHPPKKNSLRDLKIGENAALLVETKEENEVANDQAWEDQLEYQKQNRNFNSQNVDETENIRTVIVNTESDKEDYQRFQIDIHQTFQQLTDFLVKQLKLEEPHRLRNLTYNRLYAKEELDTPLKNYPDFQEGGARVQIEQGRYPTMAEIVLKVAVYNKEEDLRQFYISADATAKECKELVCREFGQLLPSKHTLYRVDYLEDPVFAIRRESQPLKNCLVQSGDILIIKNDADLMPEEVLNLHIHMTLSGQPEDSQYVEKIEVSREYTLKDLKEVVLSMPQFDFAKDYPIEQIRVREKQRNLYFGKIYRDHNKSLKQLQVQNNCQIVIQVMQEPEILDANVVILMLCKRKVKERTYGPKHEFKFSFPNQVPLIAHLLEACKQYCGVEEQEIVQIAKYIPHNFEWKWMNPNEEVIEKKKKNKEVRFLAGDQDVRKFPFCLKDGDIIGIRLEKENEEGQDDFQTEEDADARLKFTALREEERKDRAKDQQRNGKKGKQAEVGLQIFADF